MNQQTLALLAILGAALVGGGGPVFVKIALKEIPPLSFTFIRFLLALVFIWPLFIKDKVKINKKFLLLGLVSLFSTVNIILFAFGVRLTTAFSGQIIYVFVPIITAILSYFLVRERFGLRKSAGVIIGLIGTLLIVFLPNIKQGSLDAGNVRGNLLILSGAVLYAAYLVLSKKMQKQYSPIQITTVFLLTTTLVSAVFLPNETMIYPDWFKHTSQTAWLALGYVVFFHTVFYYLLTQYAIKYGSATIGSLTLYLQPMATFIWAAVLLGERLSSGLLIGGLLALSGAYLVTKTRD